MSLNVKTFNNCVAKIRLGSLQRKLFIDIKFMKNLSGILNILYNEGYILGFYNKANGYCRVYLKYYNNCALTGNLICFYKSRRKFFVKLRDLERFAHKGELYILSTSLGFLTLRECLVHRVGGIFILKVGL